MQDPSSPRPAPPRNPRLVVIALTAVGATIFAIAYALLAFDARLALGGAVALVLALAGLAGVGLAAGAAVLRLLAERRALGVELEGTERDLVESRNGLADAQAGRREAETILGAVPLTFLIVDQSMLVQGNVSPVLTEMLGQERVAGENFLNLLQRILTDRLFRTSRDFLSIVFDPAKKERTLAKINPLDEVEVHGADRSVRYLSFHFRRIVEAGTIARVLVSVEEITDRVLRERALRESEKQNLKQFELLIGILHVPASALDDFVSLAKEQLREAEDAMSAQDFAGTGGGDASRVRDRIDDVMRAIHNVKGNASLLHLTHFERKASTFEARLLDLRNRPAFSGEDFLSIVVEQADFRTDLDDLQTLRVKLAGLQRSASMAEQSGDDLLASVASLAKSIAIRQGKEVRVDSEGFDSRRLPAPLRNLLRDVLIQLTRNSISHGVEPKAEREAAGKPAVATIAIKPLEPATAGTFGFTFRDDGRGLDPRTIRERAVAQGLVEADAARAIDDSEIAGFIFSPGFSTGAAGDDAGRGMGMNVVKKRIVDEAGGEIAMNSEVGGFCEFTFVVPLAQAALA